MPESRAQDRHCTRAEQALRPLDTARAATWRLGAALVGLWGSCPLGPGMQGPGQVPQEEWKLSTCLSTTHKAIQTFASDKSPRGPRGLEASQGPLVASLVAVLLALNPHKPARAQQPAGQGGVDARARG